MAVVLLPLLLVLGAGGGVGAAIIPEELPSLLSVAYSNIPPIKKGTDSRVGFGFAFGNHADLQVLLELGPQTNTLNLTGQGFAPAAGNAKRHAAEPPRARRRDNTKEKPPQSEAGKYLQGWAELMRRPRPPPGPRPAAPGAVPDLGDALVELVERAPGQYELLQPPGNLPKYTLDKLKTLYGEETTTSTSTTSSSSRSAEEIRKITKELSDVDLD